MSPPPPCTVHCFLLGRAGLLWGEHPQGSLKGPLNLRCARQHSALLLPLCLVGAALHCQGPRVGGHPEPGGIPVIHVQRPVPE